ncbi:LuxR C-terminal-related transcriptional regulator [Adlercreutzia equolifaciens]|uniref:helix-turn-helix transcriptional regulator n=1 Tax=Adlercreutzia equolifaciens TaxID=446660 RepID=UPI0023AE8D89|nr:LuxR family transcriptional regulator [Adlercreutzia equolifaciens]MDE8702068.1 LuxR C-terminal-related transcriptional regulator [Adlercreutzia equolifaciens]
MTEHLRHHSAMQGALEKLEGAFKLRYLGIGFIWSWVYASYNTFAVFPDRSGVSINADASWLVSAITAVVVFWLGGLIGARFQQPRAPRLAMAAAVLLALGTLISAAPGLFGSAAAALVIVSGLLTGFGSGVLTLLWGQALAELDTECAELAIPAASVVMLGCSLVLPYLPSLLGLLATTSLPLISGVFLLLTYRDLAILAPLSLDAEISDHQAAPTPASTATPSLRDALDAPAFRTFARIAVLLFLSYFAIGSSEALQTNADAPLFAFGVDAPSLIGSACGVLLFVAFLFFAARPTFDALFRLIAPLIVGSLVLLPWADLWAVFVGTTFTAVTNTILDVAAMLFIITLAHRWHANALLGIGITQGSLHLGVVAGNVFGDQASRSMLGGTLDIFTITLIIIAVFSLAWLFFPADRPKRGQRLTDRAAQTAVASSAAFAHQTAALSDTNALGTTTAADLVATPMPQEVASLDFAPEATSSLDATCAALAQSHGLSGRETEILGYLARGRSQPYIREELVLSKNTVATHVKHIYQKLNVHSRQELLDLIESAR